MNTRVAMLEAIRLNPDNEVIRLGFADLLDDEANDSGVCESCGGGILAHDLETGEPMATCLMCHGFVVKDWVSAAHAELIRLQCGSPPMKSQQCSACDTLGMVYSTPGEKKSKMIRCENCNNYEIRWCFARKDDLLDLLRPHLCPVCPVCDGRGNHADPTMSGEPTYRACRDCSGRGTIGTISRGFCESVTVPSMRTLCDTRTEGEVSDRGGWFREVWQPTPWARDLLEKCPVLQRIECPSVVQMGGENIWSNYIPDVVEARMRGMVYREELGNRMRSYPNPKDGIADLSQATLATLREMIAAEKGVTT